MKKTHGYAHKTGMEGKSVSSRLSTKDEWTSQVGFQEDAFYLLSTKNSRVSVSVFTCWTGVCYASDLSLCISPNMSVLNYLQITVQPLDDIKLRRSLRALKDLVQTALGPNGR